MVHEIKVKTLLWDPPASVNTVNTDGLQGLHSIQFTDDHATWESEAQ